MATGSVAALGEQFVTAASSIAQALANLERTRLTHAAGELPLEQIDRVADEILLRSAQQDRDLEQLASSIQN